MPITEAIEAEDLADLRADLEAKRKELATLYEHDVQVGRESTDDNADDFADRANNSYNRETMFALSDVERETLISISDAFQRLDKGTYGVCDYCNATIGLPRLKAVPWALFCIDCQEKKERGLLDA